jgi:peptide/nickel transport system substrate-binding protein
MIVSKKFKRSIANKESKIMTFIRLPRALMAAALAVPLAFGSIPSSAHAETVLRVIPHADLKNLDPIWTTAYISRNHGYMIYDTLFAMDESFTPQPQMVDTWTTSDDGLIWTFVLRDGLTFHDGAPVTGEDVVASLNRWGKRDGMGQQLFSNTASLEATDEKTVVLTLSSPFGLVLESIGKISSNVPFIMPKRIADTDAFEQITEYVGSGPFVFQEDEWVPGSKVVYTKFEDYVPRTEPASAAAGGKIAKVDKVIWQYFPDNTTAMNALMAGEVDYFEQPAPDLAPILASNPDVTVEVNDPLGSIGFARFNHVLPPFDDVEIRKAAIMAMKQEDYLASGIGDQQFWKTCYSVYPCGTPLANDAGSDLMATGDIEAAKAALAATGYDGTEVVIMQPTDVPVLSAFSLVTGEKLRNAGFNVKMEAMDWATLTSRRALRDPVGEGGWNMFHTWWIGADVMNPMAIAFSGNPDAGWFGWPDDAALEEARSGFATAATAEEKLALATDAQERLWDIGASGQLGQFFVPVAYRNNVKGLIKSPVQFFWNMSVE